KAPAQECQYSLQPFHRVSEEARHTRRGGGAAASGEALARLADPASHANQPVEGFRPQSCGGRMRHRRWAYPRCEAPRALPRTSEESAIKSTQLRQWPVVSGRNWDFLTWRCMPVTRGCAGSEDGP